MDVLAFTNRTNECSLIQVLGCLKKAQMLIASVKAFNMEEDRVIEVNDAALVKIDTDKRRPIPVHIAPTIQIVNHLLGI